MYKAILNIAMLLYSFGVNSQSFSIGCLTQQSHEERLSNSPELILLYEQTQNIILHERDVNSVRNRASYIIPVVFHVVWKEEEENISKEQILSQLDALNDAFGAQNFDVRFLPNLFESSVANIGLAFCLASNDPDGNEHSGINRFQTDLDVIGDEENLEGKPRIKYTGLGGIDAWDANRFINIWVGKKELGFGEATLPGSSSLEEQGLIIDPYFLGTIGTGTFKPDYDRGRVAVHEMGHYFNLKHLFGDAQDCNSDDNIEDTPLQLNAYSGCPDFPQISCNSADMFMNFMALTDDQCVKFFTQGQKEMMLATLDTDRSELKNSTCIFIPDSNSLEQKISVLYLFRQDLIELNLTLSRNEILEIFLYDISGRLHFQDTVDNRSFYHIDIHDLFKGIYLLELKIGDNYLVEKFYKP